MLFGGFFLHKKQIKTKPKASDIGAPGDFFEFGQVGFIEFVICPMAESITNIFPQVGPVGPGLIAKGEEESRSLHAVHTENPLNFEHIPFFDRKSNKKGSRESVWFVLFRNLAIRKAFFFRKKAIHVDKPIQLSPNLPSTRSAPARRPLAARSSSSSLGHKRRESQRSLLFLKDLWGELSTRV